MKILFLIGAVSRIRNFDDTLLRLAERGHDIRLTGRLRKGTFEVEKVIDHPRVTGRVNPTDRSDAWRDVVDLLRGARDYVRYFDPRYAQATRLVRRAYDIAPTAFALYCDRHPWVKRHWSLVAKALAFGETLIPSDPAFEAFLRDEGPDLVLVSPLVTFEHYQTDYVKAAHRLGIPVVFLPFSWDNLTNKGLVRVQPDRVLVWNEVQQQEAIDLHDCRPDDIAITGAPRFDSFFRRRPETERAAFCAEYGLDPGRPFLLYLGSSQLTGPNEPELVRRWAESIRAADDDVLRTCGILIRPHPALRGSYASADFSGLTNIGLSLTAKRDGDQDLFDSLHHAHAAVGLNTSAMLEAAIVGTPVHTLVIPGFDSGQVGTMHFHYLVASFGGVAAVARDFAEHHQQLVAVLRSGERRSERSRTFAAGFLRPHGLDRDVSPILADAIEQSAALIRKSPAPAPPFWHKPLGAGLLWWLRRRIAHTPLVDDTSIIATSMSLRMVRTALQEIQQGSAPVFVGPWLDSTENELLHWIPFLRRTASTYGLRPERLIVLTDGGARDWYGGLAQRYLDITTLFSPQELEHWRRRTVPQSEQDPKQAVMWPFDQEIVDRAVRTFDISAYQVLHPSAFFRIIGRLRKDRALERLSEVQQYAVCTPSPEAEPMRLPESFVAVSLAFTEALPQSDDSEEFLRQLLAESSARHEVVVVDDPTAIGPSVAGGGRIHRLQAPAGSSMLRMAQTQALSRARLFIGGYGELAVIASACGTPVRAYQAGPLPAEQLEWLRVAAAGGWGEVTVEKARRFKAAVLKQRAQA